MEKTEIQNRQEKVKFENRGGFPAGELEVVEKKSTEKLDLPKESEQDDAAEK